MKRKVAIFVALIFVVFMMVVYSVVMKMQRHNTNENKHPNTEQKVEIKDPIKERIKEMTLNEKIGQMVIVGIDGYAINENTFGMINDNHVGGFILFKKNIKNAEQTVNLLNSLKQANMVNKVPLFLSVDEEGGRISRMPKEFKKIPTSKRIGQINSEEFSYKIGEVIGEEIKSLGFNMNYAPVLDINSNPKNPVIGDRAFGSKPEVVSNLGTATMKGLQAENVIPVVKHFPGHGDTGVDSHIGLPSLSHDIVRLKKFELAPFQSAVNNGADAVMVAHILLPKIDKENPASLSQAVITGILREQLNFDGVVITDDMTMGAIVKNYDIGEASVKSVNAGTDIVLVCHGPDNKLAVINSLRKAAEDGIISQKRIDESVYRILKLKDKYRIKDTDIGSVDIAKINKNISQLLDAYLHKR